MATSESGNGEARGPARPDSRRASRDVLEVPAQLGYPKLAPTGAIARIVRYSRPQRLARGIKGGLASWGLAVASVFIPLAHFVLVPMFLIGGPVVLFLRLGEDVSLKSARGACPACGAEQEFTEHGRLLDPHPVRCSACGRTLQLAADREASGLSLRAAAGSR